MSVVKLWVGESPIKRNDNEQAQLCKCCEGSERRAQARNGWGCMGDRWNGLWEA